MNDLDVVLTRLHLHVYRLSNWESKNALMLVQSTFQLMVRMLLNPGLQLHSKPDIDADADVSKLGIFWCNPTEFSFPEWIVGIEYFSPKSFLENNNNKMAIRVFFFFIEGTTLFLGWPGPTRTNLSPWATDPMLGEPSPLNPGGPNKKRR